MFFQKLGPAGYILAGILGIVAISQGVMSSVLRTILPFVPGILPLLISLGLIIYGCWRYLKIYVLPLFAHKIGPWKYDRISIIEFVRLAGTRYGWNLGDGSIDSLDLIAGVGQACAEGRVLAHGRFNPRRLTDFVDQIYLVPIRKSYWRLNYLEASNGIRLGDNHQTTSCSVANSEKRDYMDLHLNRIQALAWLERQGSNWKDLCDRKLQNKLGKSVLREEKA